jgi:hypothetical protein
MSVFLNRVAEPKNVAAALQGELPWTSQPFVDTVELTRDRIRKASSGSSMDKGLTVAQTVSSNHADLGIAA